MKQALTFFTFVFVFLSFFLLRVPSAYATTDTIIVNAAAPVFKLAESANPTTGYRWELEHYDHTLLTLVNSHYIPSQKGLVGSGGTMVWVFRAKPRAFRVQKATEIHIVYARPWAPSDNPRHVVVNILFKSS